MEIDAREHLNLAHYNFNKMAVIDEEGIENMTEPPSKPRPSNQSREGGSRTNNYLINAGQDLRAIKNMHNTTSGFYPQSFGDRVPTRGDMESRGGNRRNLIPSAAGGRRGNSRADNSLGRAQINQAQVIGNKGSTHYGNMFNESNAN